MVPALSSTQFELPGTFFERVPNLVNARLEEIWNFGHWAQLAEETIHRRLNLSPNLLDYAFFLVWVDTSESLNYFR